MKKINTIKNYFDQGYDVTIGSLFRADKPFKKYSIVDFKKSWHRDGDNIWLHPKCFKRLLCNYIGDFLKDKKGNYIGVSTKLFRHKRLFTKLRI